MAAMATTTVKIPAGSVELEATLQVPSRLRGVLLLADAGLAGPSGPTASAAWDRGHRFLASAWNEASFATLHVGLLADGERDEAVASRVRFDVALLASRLAAATDFLSTLRQVADLPVGYFGAGTGAAVALHCAASRSDVRAVVSRSGRLDLAMTRLDQVKAPTLLLVAGSDEAVQRVNRQAASTLRCTKELVTIHGAGHLFEEAGAMAQAASVATVFFARHLAPPEAKR